MKTQLSDTKTGGQCGKGGDRHEYRFGIRQVKLDALHHFGKGQITRSIVGDDMYQHRSPLRALYGFICQSVQVAASILWSPVIWKIPSCHLILRASVGSRVRFARSAP